jgi:hypothetical protein
MEFIQLTHDSSVDDAKTYLVQLGNSPFHYHLDDSLTEDFNWADSPPDPETLKVMQSNADILWWMHLNDIMMWDETWDVFADAYRDYERKQSIENNH